MLTQFDVVSLTLRVFAATSREVVEGDMDKHVCSNPLLSWVRVESRFVSEIRAADNICSRKDNRDYTPGESIRLLQVRPRRSKLSLSEPKAQSPHSTFEACKRFR